MPNKNSKCAAIKEMGIVGRVGSTSSDNFANSFLNNALVSAALISTAIAAFQPNTETIKDKSQPHFSATINTGGAAYGVSTPPMEILTNKTDSETYLNRFDTT